jgi:GH3 auxin-responsive promoter
MGIRSVLSKPLAALVAAQTKKWQKEPALVQKKWRERIVSSAISTAFGKDHQFASVESYEDFKSAVPIRDYEQLKPYISRITEGEPDVLWNGKPLYLSKTSGTTSGVKYIPITTDSISNHIDSAKNALLAYIHETGNAQFIDEKLIFLSGSPALDKKAGIFTGRLSGISNHHVPSYLRTNQLPSYATNCIEDWEEKLERIIDETLGQSMGLISGIPPWVQMYFDRIQARTGKHIKDVFPKFDLFVYGGVNFEPYRAKLIESIGRPINSIELYPASEGFIAYQDSQQAEGLLLVLDSGIFFEFIPADEYFSENPTRLSVEQVELGKNYALIINSNAGLWGYSIGDTVKFVSLAPHRIIVTGRIKHFISAFGEHVIGEEVEKAMHFACKKHPEVELVEFTVAPMVSPAEGLPYHEWLIEFAKPPYDMGQFAKDLDQKMTELNVYYQDLIRGAILKPLVVKPVKTNSFIHYMKSVGKLGGQNKVARLANDRKIADALG